MITTCYVLLRLFLVRGVRDDCAVKKPSRILRGEGGDGAQLAVDLARPGADQLVQLLAGLFDALLRRFQHAAEGLKLGFDGAEDVPDLAAALLDRQRAEAHLQAVEQRGEVVGPEMLTLYCRWRTSSMPMRTTSAYSPSKGRNMMAKSVVLGGSMYLSRISFAQPLIRTSSALCAAAICAGSPLS